MYADIIIDISHEQLDKTFQYAVPEQLEGIIEIGMTVDIPFGTGNRNITGYVVELGDKPKYPVDKIKYINGITKNRVSVENRMVKLALWLKRNYGSTMNQALKTVIPVKDKVRQKEKKSVNLIADEMTVKNALEQFQKKNVKARLRLLTALVNEPVIDYEIVKTKLNISQQTIKALENMGLIQIKSEELYRNPVKASDKAEKRVVLNEEQKNAVNTIISDYDSGNYNTYLLHGVTGSGKTEVYLDVIEHVVKNNRQVIVLIPEIALTFQTVQRFYKRFGDRVSIMNSRMSKGERYDQFMRAKNGDISIMIGPRSALFTPFSNIGLIVIDEEHESAYKSETVPRYHARPTAVHIAKEAGASVILGSATPSVESFYYASTGKYRLLELGNRAGSGTMPDVHIVDLREELRLGNRTMFSSRLRTLMQDRLNRHEQIMLFLNKRGVAGFISCRSCGKVMKCPHCDVSLTEHANGRLVCHYCGYTSPAIRICPECGSKYVSGFRAGTEAVEQNVKKMFPSARVLRMDMDTTKGKDGHEKILSEFANENADILIGTQMIVKGHDFPNVTLVGVLAADMSLYASDFRASERTFQLLTQAAGRAGRAAKPGEVVIQTYTPQHFSIVSAAKQDYNLFYKQEIAYRKIMGYPPVSNLMKIMLSSEDEECLAYASEQLKAYIDRECKNSGIMCIGPAQAPIYKIKDIYNRIIYAKHSDRDKLTYLYEKLDAYIVGNADFRNVNIQYDING